MKIVKIILALIVLGLSAYQLITENFVIPYYMLILGAFMLVTGLVELQKDRKGGFLGCVIVSLFLFFVSLQGLLMN
ncbi:DUF3953 domain-containing protein [Peribacillus muralis]|uniref:DUF3953 domain-containing protein n=1 Tax=Peribacillus muralis TaxID=264697 RepID=UPI00366DB0C0